MKNRNSWNKGQYSGNKTSDHNQGDKEQGESSFRGNYRGKRPFNRYRRTINGPIKFYNCNQLGHLTSRCHEKRNNKNQEERRDQLIEEDKHDDNRDLEPKEGECLMMRQAFLQVPQTQEPP